MCKWRGIPLYPVKWKRIIVRWRWKRVKFCWSITKYKNGQRFWNTEISIYNDGEEFQHKQITLNHARAPKTRERSKKGMGVQRKGKKRLAGIPKLWLESDLEKVLYCISIILAQMFPDSPYQSANKTSKWISKLSLKAIKETGAIAFKIPQQNLGLKPIENFLNLVLQQLHQQALDQRIENESFSDFSAWVRNTLVTFNIDKINKYFWLLRNACQWL